MGEHHLVLAKCTPVSICTPSPLDVLHRASASESCRAGGSDAAPSAFSNAENAREAYKISMSRSALCNASQRRLSGEP